MQGTNHKRRLQFGALCDETPEVRLAAAKTFESLHNTVGSRALDDILPPMLAQITASKSDEDDEESSGKLSVSCQLESYLKEVPIKSKSCPGDWWRLNETKYPEIGKLARKYLAIQGTSTPAARVMSDMGLILNKKRLAMTDEHFRMLMYLGDAKQ